MKNNLIGNDAVPRCKHGRTGCGTEWTCGTCKAEIHKRIRAQQTQEDVRYDDFVESKRAYRDEECCSCHINPPCSFCISQPEI